MNRKVLAVSAVGSLLANACAKDGRTAGSARSPSDTVVVLTTGDGEWGPAHDAVEVLRVSGDTKETSFGQVRTIAATPDGGVIVFDVKGAEGRIIRQFDANGKFVRNIGRSGEGPGEYNTDNLRLVVSRAGTILVRDLVRGVSRYARDGRFLDGFLMQFGAGYIGLVAADDGSIYMPATYGPGVSNPRGDRDPILRFDSAGRVLDTIAPGLPWLAGSDTTPAVSLRQFTPRENWTALADGRVVIGRSDKVGFLLVDPRGSAAPLVAEHPSAPVPYLEDERKELQANHAALLQRAESEAERVARGPVVTVPATKQVSGPLLADADLRIWVPKNTASQKTESRCVASDPDVPGMCHARASYSAPPAFAAFKLDGTYLGEVRFSIKTSYVSFVGPYAWAITRDDDDVQVLTKYRLHQ